MDLDARAALHAALGEPARLAIVDELSSSDRSPTELGEMLHLPGNLIAHHLDALERVGLIERQVSAGDRRRRYIRLVRRQLADLGIATARPAGRVLFVCTNNSARSQLAAALWTARTGEQAGSAGTQPADRVHPGAVAAARRAGLDLSNAVPRSLTPAEVADLYVTVCDRAHEELRPDVSNWHWSIPDPVAARNADAFDTALHDLDDRIRSLQPKG